MKFQNKFVYKSVLESVYQLWVFNSYSREMICTNPHDTFTKNLFAVLNQNYSNTIIINP